MKEKNICLNTRRDKTKGRGFAEECLLSVYDELIQSEWLKNQLKLIADADGDEDRQKKLKEALPFRCPHYTRFQGNQRNQKCADPESFTWMTCVDIDDKELVEGAIKRAMELNAEEGGTWHGMVLHMDYSARKKLHIDIRLPLGMTVPEAQRAFCQALGVEPDTSCFTPERFIYITPASHEIYRSEHWCEPLEAEEVARRRKAYQDRKMTIDGRDDSGRYVDPASTTQKPQSAPQPTEKKPRSSFPTTFKGIAYSDILEAYWKRNGGEPVKGERNKRLHLLACHLRSICDDNADWLMQVMPRYELTEQELRTIVNSACKEPTMGSKLMTDIVEELKEEAEPAEETPDDRSAYNLVLKKLPIGLKESLRGVPENMHMPVISALMPIAGAYASHVEVNYDNASTDYLALMAIVVGDQASGKSICKRRVEAWLKQMKEEDEQGWEAEEAWHEQRATRKANEKAQPDPRALIRLVPVTISNSQLLKRLKNCQGETLFSIDDELGTMIQTNKAGSWSEKYDKYRKAFDRSDFGQDFASEQSQSGNVPVNYNWTILGTPGAVRKAFENDNSENGLGGRVLFATMPESAFARRPRYGKLTGKDEEQIQRAVTMLRQCSGLVDTPRLRKAMHEWDESVRLEASKAMDLVKDAFRRRSAVIGFRCGVIFHILTGKKRETDACIEFGVMMARYCLERQIRFLGKQLKKQQRQNMEAVTASANGANQTIFDLLPDVFDIEHVIALKGNDMPRTSIRKIISRWKNDGLIEKVDGRYRKKQA